MKRWTLLVLAVLAVAIVAAEVGLRLVGLGDPPIAILDDELEYRLAPDRKYSRWGNRIQINNYGFRAPDHPETAAMGEVRLLLIGDSVVYGNHFLDQEETVALRLSDMLSTSDCVVRVIPVAVSSWGPVNQAAALAKYGVFGATEAAIVLSAHDLIDTPGSVGNLVPYRLSPSVGALGDLVEAVLERVFPASPPAPTETYEERAQAGLSALDTIHDRLSTDGVGLRLVYNPTTPERAGSVAPERERLFAWAQAHGIPTLDLGAVPGITYRDTIHPDAGGAARISEALAETYASRLACDDDP